MALKGWTVGGTAQSYYEAGVRLSMEQNGVAGEDIDAYLADETLVPAGHLNDPRGAKYNYDRQTDVKIKWNDAGRHGEESGARHHPEMDRKLPDGTRSVGRIPPYGLSRTGARPSTTSAAALSPTISAACAGCAIPIPSVTSTRAITTRRWHCWAVRTTSRSIFSGRRKNSVET